MQIRGTLGVALGVATLLLGLLVLAASPAIFSTRGLVGAALAASGMIVTWWSHVESESEL